MRRYDAVKRAVDVAVAGLGLIVSAPIQLVVAGIVRKKLGSPVLFRQQRPGRYGVPFTLIKFRTLLNVDEARGLITDEQRMTALGKLLRSTSLDELPTLWNVVKGEMSLIGPRPLLVEYLPRYTTEQARRHEVRPGITGLAQVSGRNGLPWEQRFELDVKYVDSRSARVDLGIVKRTIVQVLRRDGISEQGQVTMSKFGGRVDPATRDEKS